MTRHIRLVTALALAILAGAALSACGSSSGSHSASSVTGASVSQKSGGTISVVQSTYPDSLDPAFDYVTQGSETIWLVYTGLLTYAHKSGAAGSQLIPGLATALPTISDGGRTYTAYLRKGLRYSDGRTARASDFRFAIERAVRVPWGGSGEFITPIIAGASAFASHRATTISGIVTDDDTGKIVIHLTRPYGAFDNVLAEPAAGLQPTGSAPFRNDPLHPPPGVGPYMVKNIVVNQSYSVVKNPYWKPLPGIPAAKADIDVRVSGNVTSNAEEVLSNATDVFDFADTIPGSLLPQIQARARSRFSLENLGQTTFYFFLNSHEKPFSSQLAREAVVTGLDEDAYEREGAGTLAPACFLLPPAVPGHPTNAKCPYGTPGTGNLAKARAMVKRSGMAGQAVTVWSQTRQPRQTWATTYTQYLNELGFHATLKVIADATYFPTIGELKLHPQTGLADWVMDFPNPIDFYGVLLNGKAIQPTNNENYGEVNDPYLNREIAKLAPVPSTKLASIVPIWQRIDEYEAGKAYMAVFGYEKYPFFASDRIDYPAAVKTPLEGWDFSSLSLK